MNKKKNIIRTSRETELSWVLKIINNSSTFHKLNNTNNFSICINARWGEGKTYFIKELLINELNKNKNNIILYYDAWRYDWEKTPFNSLFKFLERELKEQCVELSKVIGESLLRNIMIAAISCMPFVGKITSILTKAKQKAHEYYDKFIRDEISDFHNNLSKQIKNKKLILCIDELDRCKPSYAIELLEITKHMFDIPNIILVYGINKNVLDSSINHMYGMKEESEKYLYRMFDVVHNLSKITNKNFLEVNFANEKLLWIIPCLFDLYFNEFSLRTTIEKINKICILFNLINVPINEKEFAIWMDRKHETLNALTFLFFMCFKEEKEYHYPDKNDFLFDELIKWYIDNQRNRNIIHNKKKVPFLEKFCIMLYSILEGIKMPNALNAKWLLSDEISISEIKKYIAEVKKFLISEDYEQNDSEN